MLQRFYKFDLSNIGLRTLGNEPIAAQSIRWVRGDEFVICGQAVYWNGESWADYVIPATTTLVAILKLGPNASVNGLTLPNGTTADTSLAFSDADQVNISGDWDQAAAGSAKFSIRIALTWEVLRALVDANRTAGSIKALFEVVATDINGKQASLGQATVTILWDAYRGDEEVGTDFASYYTKAVVDAMFNARIVTEGGKRLRVAADGTFGAEDVT